MVELVGPYSLILYLLLFLSVNSQNDNSSLCITGEINPRNSIECNRYNTDEYYCCYLTPIEHNNTSLCYKYDVIKYNGEGSINYKQNSYSIYCGLGTKVATLSAQGSLGSPCGIRNPMNEKACNSVSSLSNSCCFYNYEGLTGCYWLGAKYFGSTYYKDLTLTCSSRNTLAYIFILIFYNLILFV